MLQNITLGQYFPGTSILHRLDPRVKIVLLLTIMVLLFLIDSSVAYAMLTAFVIIITAISQIPPLTILKSLKPIIWIVLFTFIVHLFSGEGEVLYEIGALSITLEGAFKGLLISLRLVLLIVLSSLLTFTTSPIRLTDAMEKLLSPLAIFGLRSHELAMMMTIALRFIPTLLEETDIIIKAQSARGVDFESGNFLMRVKSMVPIIVPLFLSAFRRADELAMAMEARCYRGGEGRTQLKKLHITSIDYIAIFTVWIVVVLIQSADIQFS